MKRCPTCRSSAVIVASKNNRPIRCHCASCGHSWKPRHHVKSGLNKSCTNPTSIKLAHELMEMHASTAIDLHKWPTAISFINETLDTNVEGTISSHARLAT